MANLREGPELRAKQYAHRYDRPIEDELGFGYDGIVFSTTCQSAIKALRYEPLYQRERDVYLRIEENEVTEVCGCRIPKLLVMEDWRAEKRERLAQTGPGFRVSCASSAAWESTSPM